MPLIKAADTGWAARRGWSRARLPTRPPRPSPEASKPSGSSCCRWW